MADAQHHLIVREGISVAIALLILVFVPLVLLAYRHAIWRAMSSFLSSHDGGKLNIPQWLRHDLRRTAVIAIGVFIGLAAWSWWR